MLEVIAWTFLIIIIVGLMVWDWRSLRCTNKTGGVNRETEELIEETHKLAIDAIGMFRDVYEKAVAFNNSFLSVHNDIIMSNPIYGQFAREVAPLYIKELEELRQSVVRCYDFIIKQQEIADATASAQKALGEVSAKSPTPESAGSTAEGKLGAAQHNEG